MPKKIQPKNEVCTECMKWDQFGEDCHVYWENKKFCTLKVRDMAEWTEQNQILK